MGVSIGLFVLRLMTLLGGDQVRRCGGLAKHSGGKESGEFYDASIIAPRNYRYL
jgi:hypothetical protein